MKKLVVLTMLFLGMTAQAGVLRVSAAANVGAADRIVYLTGTAIYSVTLPSCSSSNDGELHSFRGISSLTHCVTVNAASGQSIDGASGQAVCAYQAAEVACDGSNNNWVNLSYF